MSADTQPENGANGANGVTQPLSPDEVRAALERTVSSEAFGKAERPARFLRHLVETTLRGESQYLKESLLGTEVFGRPASWDPRLDPIVRQEAARLRKRLARYKEAAGDSEEVWIELPVGGYVPVFEHADRPGPAVAPAAEEVTEPAPKVTADEPASSPKPRRVWIYVAAAVIATGGVAGAIAAWRAAQRPELPSIVVLPFANLTGQSADDYFAAGLTDEITDSLTRYRRLRVIARSSASQFQGKKADARIAGRELGVTHVLEGSVERSGDRIKVIAHLERASDASLAWSNVYERKASDLYALQSELAGAIAGNLKVAGAPGAAHVPRPDAYALTLQARYDMQRLSLDSLARAEEKYRKALELDPEYAAAYYWLANVYYDRAAARSSTGQTTEERNTAEALFRKAVELDPELSGAHAMLAALAMQYSWDWAGAERELRMAVAGPPSAAAEMQYALLLTYRGRFAEADPHVARALELDPFSTATLNNSFLVRNMEARFAEARDFMQRMAAQSKVPAAQLVIGLTFVEQRNPKAAIPIFEETRKRFAPAALFLAMAEASEGERAKALELLKPYEAEGGAAGISMQWPAMVYAYLGDADNTARWMERAADRRDFQALTAAVHPAFRKFHDVPRYHALLERMDLADVKPR